MMIYYHLCNVFIYFVDAMHVLCQQPECNNQRIVWLLGIREIPYAILIFMGFYCFLLWFDNQMLFLSLWEKNGMHVHYDKHKRRKQLVQAWFEDVQKEKNDEYKVIQLDPWHLTFSLKFLWPHSYWWGLLNTYNMSLILYLSYASYELKT